MLFVRGNGVKRAMNMRCCGDDNQSEGRLFIFYSTGEKKIPEE